MNHFCLVGDDLSGGLLPRFCRVGVLGMFCEVSLTALFLGGAFFLFGIGFTETGREEKAMNAFFVALFEKKIEAIVGFDPCVQDFLEVGEEPRLDSLEFARKEFAVDFFLTAFAWTVRQDVSAADFVFADFFVCPSTRGGDDVDVVFLADAIAQGAEDFYDGVDNRGVLVVMFPFDDELQWFSGVDDNVGTVEFFGVEHRFRCKRHVFMPSF